MIIRVTMHLVVILQKTMYGANVIIFEGILTFYNQEIVSVNRHGLTNKQWIPSEV